MKTKLDEILTELYRAGKVSIAESVTLIAGVVLLGVILEDEPDHSVVEAYGRQIFKGIESLIGKEICDDTNYVKDKESKTKGADDS